MSPSDTLGAGGLPARAQSGFTLVEMMIVVAVVAILAAIALPSYNSYIIKSEIRTSQSDLLALGLNFENRYQRTFEYPSVDTSASTNELKVIFTGWSPSADNFSYSLTVSTSSTYTLKATGSGRQAGCEITLTHLNERATSAGCLNTNGGWL